VTAAVLLLGAVTAERLAELWLARRNTALLIAQGARELAPGIIRQWSCCMHSGLQAGGCSGGRIRSIRFGW
jgi:methyltransferase